MAVNLYQQYAAVSHTFEEIRNFRLHLEARQRNPQLRWAWTVGRIPPGPLETIRRNASPTDQKNKYFGVIVTEFPTHSICEFLLTQFPDIDFARLSKFHIQRQARSLRPFDKNKVLSFILAAGILLLKNLPQEVVTKYLGLKYSDFQDFVFWYAVAVAGYVLVIFGGMYWWTSWLSRQYLGQGTNKHIVYHLGYVLEYAALVQGADKE